MIFFGVQFFDLLLYNRIVYILRGISRRKEGEIMPEEFKPGCQRPAINKPEPANIVTNEAISAEVKQAMIRVGKPAPDFTAAGYFNGKFMNFSLSEYLGKWVLLCFYPGDFTFV
jgi:peroxiredoxin (alkyl hydroperoxide reductase subunit C)